MESTAPTPFEQFYDSHSDALYRSVFFRVNSVDIASDIVQESFVRIWKNWDNYDSDIHRTRAIYTIARNLLTDHYRRSKRSHPTDIGELDLASQEDTPDVAENKRIITQQLAHMLQELPDTDRHIIVEHTINETPYSEISRELQKPEPTIRKIHSRALQKLKQLFQKQYGINYLPY